MTSLLRDAVYTAWKVGCDASTFLTAVAVSTCACVQGSVWTNCRRYYVKHKRSVKGSRCSRDTILQQELTQQSCAERNPARQELPGPKEAEKSIGGIYPVSGWMSPPHMVVVRRRPVWREDTAATEGSIPTLSGGARPAPRRPQDTDTRGWNSPGGSEKTVTEHIKNWCSTRHTAIHPPQNTPPHFEHTYLRGLATS